MEPFIISDASKELVDQIPDSAQLAKIGPELDGADLQSIAQLWLSEGIPSAFLDSPMLYDIIRRWLAPRLGVHAKQVTLVGSARLGYSLAPAPEYGRVFGRNSDLDIVVVAEDLLTTLSEEFRQWAEDFKSGTVSPSTDRERRYWPDHYKRVPGNLSNGFINANRVPPLPRYPTARAIERTMEVLKDKLNATPDAPQVKRASLRVYRSWESFVAQSTLSLARAFGSVS